MGHSYVHPENPNHIVTKTSETISYPLGSSPDFTDAFHQPRCSVQPIIIPRFEVKCSPFKTYMGKDEFLLQRATACSNQGEPGGLNFQTEIKASQSVNQISWNSILYDPKILHRILDLLPAEDYLNLTSINRRFSCQMYLYRLFHRPNNWNFITFHIKKKIRNQQNRLSFKKVLNESYHEQSQHSLDLDRLDSLLSADQNSNQSLARIDKIMKAIHASGVGYFQGLNSIVIAGISQFSDQVTYWLVLMLLHKSQDIQDNPEMYQQLMEGIDKKIKQKCPRVFNKLEDCDLGVEYFAMKWIMSLFSVDVCHNLLIHFWDLLINFGIPALTWFIVSLYANLQEIILSINKADDLNKMMKNQLRSVINEEIARKILQDTRTYMAEEMFGIGCWEMIQNWNFYQKQIHKDLSELRAIHQNQICSPINPINEEQQHSVEQQNTQFSSENQRSYETHTFESNLTEVHQEFTNQSVSEKIQSENIQSSRSKFQPEQQDIQKIENNVSVEQISHDNVEENLMKFESNAGST